MVLIWSPDEWLPDKPGARDKVWPIGTEPASVTPVDSNLQVSGELDPDATGIYTPLASPFNGQPAYQGPGQWAIWYHAGAGFWVLSADGIGTQPTIGWAKPGPDVAGEYNPIIPV